jgi:hypothetical protein
MTNKLLKRHSPSRIIRKTQLTPQDTTTHLLKWLTRPSTDKTKYWQGYGTTGTLRHCWWGCSMVRSLWKQADSWYVVKHILKQPSHSMANIYLYVKSYVHTKSCTKIFIAVLFLIAKNCIQLKSLSTAECKNYNSSYNGILLNSDNYWAIDTGNNMDK